MASNNTYNLEQYIESLKAEFAVNGNAHIAKGQKAYMKDNFDFYGLKTPTRRTVQRPFLEKAFLPPKAVLKKLIETCWSLPQRDFQLFGQELAFKYLKTAEMNDIELYEFMVVNKSWWDTVDYIAIKLMGPYFQQYPNQLAVHIEKWLATENIWLHRSALLFQHSYKDDLDTDLLSHIIKKLMGSKEFFINKAIGWILRQYSRTNEGWVIEFVENNPSLHNLSKKEALRLINP